jgi:AcrR family transcriptional regulator
MRRPPPSKPARREASTGNGGTAPDTRERLLDVAEQLVALQGINSVSVRDITDAARANSAAIHYHFGSKADLIAAIVERRAEELGQRRQALLAELQQRRRKASLREVVEALVRPVAELVASSEGGQHYVSFLAALGDSPELMHLIVHANDPYTDAYLEVLAGVVSLPHDVLILRFAVAKDLINRILGQPNGQIHQWVAQRCPGADRDMVPKLVDMIVGIFSGPVIGRSPATTRRLTRARPPSSPSGTGDGTVGTVKSRTSGRRRRT